MAFNMPKFSVPNLSLSVAERVTLGVILLLVVLIPVGSYLASQYTDFIPQASDKKVKTDIPVSRSVEVPKRSALDDLKEQIKQSASESAESILPATESASLILGPTLSFKVVLEGRPIDRMATKMFLGIAAGTTVTTNPKYLLSFTINVPDTGVYKDLSIAGLETGQSYTAYLKGQAQIATSSAFTVKPIATDLGNINLTTGDVNEDNVINTADYNLVKAVLGAVPSSSNWNAIYDFNLDGVINTLDLAIISRHLGTTGQSGVWQSTPKSGGGASGSAELGSNIGAPEENDPKNGRGYWIWVPQF